jgi:hypothetical protein
MPTTLPERRSPAALPDDDFPFPLFFLIAAVGIAAQLWLGVPSEPWMPFEADAQLASGLFIAGP